MINLRRRTIALLRTNGGDHPCVFVTDPVKLKGKGRAKVLLVPLSTSPKNRDPACEFKTSPDRRVPAGSYAYYAEARISDAAEVKAELRKRKRSLSKVPMEVSRRMVAGLLRSGRTPPGVSEFYEEARRQGRAD